MKKVFIITGANGFLGNNIVRKLNQESDIEIRCLVLPNEKLDSLEGLNCEIYKGDVTKKETLDSIFEINKDDELYVIHCAGIVYIKSAYNPLVYDVNVNGTKNVIEKVLEKKGKLIYINTVHAIPEKTKNEIITETTDFDPDKVNGIYSKTKAETAKYILEMVKNKDLNACIIHPSGLIGPYDFGKSHLSQLVIDSANGTLTACVKGGYNFVDVRDVAEGIIRACTKGKKGECYILSNKYIEIKELINMVRENMKMKEIKTVLPIRFALITAPLSELYYKIKKEAPLYTKYSIYVLQSNGHFSKKKAEEELDYHNRDIRETINDTIEWFKKRKKIKK